uniref:Lysozyme g n=1 Tax=Strix occidentalis caurina TaxID=311401 RepID=A0A8D0EQY2_STROC
MWCSYSISQKGESNTSSLKMTGAVKPPDLVGSGRTNFRAHSQDPQPLSKGKWLNRFPVKTASSSARTLASASSQNPGGLSAEADIVRLRKYEIPIKRVARNLCLDPALIAAIISQESRVGLLLDNGWDQERHKYGLMQLGGQQHLPFGVWDSEEHINQCSTILVLSINEVRARHPTWTWDRQLRGGICTYRAKMGNLQVYEEDPCDRDNYYVNSVIRRAQYFKRHGF